MWSAFATSDDQTLLLLVISGHRVASRLLQHAILPTARARCEPNFKVGGFGAAEGKNIMAVGGFITSRSLCSSFERVSNWQIDRQTDKQTNRQAGRQADKLKLRQPDVADEFSTRLAMTNKDSICISRPFLALLSANRLASTLAPQTASVTHSHSHSYSHTDKWTRQEVASFGGAHLPETKRVSRATISQSFRPTALSSVRRVADCEHNSRAKSAVASR